MRTFLVAIVALAQVGCVRAQPATNDSVVPERVLPLCYEVIEQQWEPSAGKGLLTDVVPPKRFEFGDSKVSEWNPRPRLMRSLMKWPVSTQWGWGGWQTVAPARLTMGWYDISSAWGQFEITEKADTLVGKGFGASGEKAPHQRSTFRAVEISCDRARDLIRP